MVDLKGSKLNKAILAISVTALIVAYMAWDNTRSDADAEPIATPAVRLPLSQPSYNGVPSYNSLGGSSGNSWQQQQLERRVDNLENDLSWLEYQQNSDNLRDLGNPNLWRHEPLHSDDRWWETDKQQGDDWWR